MYCLHFQIQHFKIFKLPNQTNCSFSHDFAIILILDFTSISCCIKQQTVANWFDACKQGDIQKIIDLHEEFAKQRDEREFQMGDLKFPSKNSRLNFDLIVPQFTGLMYAILYGQQPVVKMLLQDELFLTTNVNVYIPVMNNVRLTFIVDNYDTSELFQKYKINQQNVVYIPFNSTVFDIAILTDQLILFDILMDYACSLTIKQQDQILQNKNAQNQNNLMLMSQLSNSKAIEFLKKYDQLIIETQFQFENIMGENSVYFAANCGNFRFLQYFISLAHDIEYRAMIDIQIDQRQFQRDLLRVFKQHSQDPKFQKCLKIFYNYRSGLYPPPPLWLKCHHPIGFEYAQLYPDVDIIEVLDFQKDDKSRESSAMDSQRLIKILEESSSLASGSSSFRKLQVPISVRRADGTPREQIIFPGRSTSKSKKRSLFSKCSLSITSSEIRDQSKILKRLEVLEHLDSSTDLEKK